MKISRILCPVDFSEFSLAALKTACDLARRFEAQIDLLHVVEPLPTSELTIAQAYDYPVDKVRADLAKLPPSDLGPQPILHRAVKLGYPAEVIISYAKESGIDLIVLGTHGRTGLSHLLLGSVAERVVRLAPCPVLVTRPLATRSGSERSPEDAVAGTETQSPEVSRV